MANELTLNATLAYSDTEGTSDSLQITNLLASVSTKLISRVKQSIATSDTAIKLGSISSLGWVMLRNADSANFVEIKIAASGTIFAKLLPGEFAFFRIGSGVTAPVAIANTAAIQLEVFLVST